MDMNKDLLESQKEKTDSAAMNNNFSAKALETESQAPPEPPRELHADAGESSIDSV